MLCQRSQTNHFICMNPKANEQLVSTGPRSPGLTINLSSNNPFRNRTASPTLSPQYPPPRPVSRNPFLDASGTPISTSPTMSQTNSTTAAPRAPLTGNAADLFVCHPKVSKFPLICNCGTTHSTSSQFSL